MNLTSAQAWEQAREQGTLQPGEQGWWKVWGASVKDVQAGDILLEKGWQEPTLIHDTFKAKADPIRKGFVSAEGKTFTLGVLVDVVVLRQGTKNTLA